MVRSVFEAIAIFAIQTSLWAVIPLSPDLSKWEWTMAYLVLFLISVVLLAGFETAYEEITGKEIPG